MQQPKNAQQPENVATRRKKSQNATTRKCAATQKPENAANHKRKLNTDQRRNLERHRTITQKTQADQPEKKKKPSTSTQKTLTSPENTNPQQKIFHPRQTNPEKTENESRDKPMALQCQNRDFWVWIFAPIEIMIWVWDFEKWIQMRGLDFCSD